MTARQIAIDGPAGAGKSTVAKKVADRLGYLYIDTGAMYRAVGLLALRSGVAFDDEISLTRLAETADICLQPAEAGCTVWCDGQDVSAEIRLPEVGNAASPVSAVPGVRRALVRLQQQMAADHPVVMDGRDIGTVVLPDAGCKVFLTASVETRAARRVEELRRRGLTPDPDVVAAEIRQRDHRDSSRTYSPLVQAADAVLIDSTDLDVEQVVAAVLAAAGE